MKKVILLMVLLCNFYSPFSQTLFTYGSNTVSKDEFLRAYDKNKSLNNNQENDIREYLDLYTRFKLKVAAARSEKLDTLPTLQYDLQVFKDQIQDNYINDKKELDRLTDEAFERSQKDIHVVHFFAPLKSGMSLKDSADANKAMEILYSELKKANLPYERIAKTVTEKYFPVKITDMGYITVFTVPYEYENIIYTLHPGQISKPYTSKNGLHIFKVIDERNSIGKWKIAQILLALPPKPQINDIQFVQKKADSLYQLLQTGADFRELAKENSNDRLTYLNGGEMPEFGCGKYEWTFEKEVIKLQKNGDICKPFITAHGIHIIKRIDQTPFPVNKNADPTFRNELNQQLSKDARINIASEKTAHTILNKIKFKRNPAINDEALFAGADTVSVKRNYGWIKKSPISNTVIFSFAKKNIKGSDWLNFIKDYKNNYQVYKGETNEELLKKYIQITGVEYYKKHLEEYNLPYKHQIQEFEDGNLLFEVMERKVWNKAANDSSGLMSYYNLHKKNYIWQESADVIIFNCPSVEAAKKIITELRNGTKWNDIADKYKADVQLDSNRYELSQLSIYEPLKPTDMFISEPLVNIKDSTVSFVQFIKIYPSYQQRSFEEARGLVINDYQNELEEKWMAVLKKKYPVKINEAVLTSILTR